MKKILLWIGGIALVLVLAFVALVVLSALNVLPVSENRASVSQDYGYDGVSAPSVGSGPSPASSPRESVSDEFSATKAGERIVIRSAQVAIVANDVRQATEALKGYAQSNGGFVVSANVESEEGYPPTAEVSFRIPADKLDATVAFVRSQAVRVASESVTGEDVTEEYVDLTAKLKNLEASESQLRAIMKNATKTEDVLNVHRELERVRGEIESLTGRKKYLEDSARLSSVTVLVATDEASLPVVESGNQWRPLVVAKGAVTAFLGVVKFLANFAIWVVIFVPIWGTAILVVRYWKRRHRGSQQM